MPRKIPDKATNELIIEELIVKLKQAYQSHHDAAHKLMSADMEITELKKELLAHMLHKHTAQ